MIEIVEFINNAVENLISNQPISNALDAEKLEPDDIVLLNNSFISRDKKDIKTLKSDRYLAIKVKEDGEFEYPPYVVSGININSDYRRIPMARYANLEITPLEEAVKTALLKFGRLVFILIGHIDDAIVIEQKLEHRAFDFIIWDPTHPDSISIQTDRIIVNDTVDESVIWKAIETYFHENNEIIPDGLQDKVAESLEKLKDKAVANLNLPTALDASMPCMIDSIIQVLQEQRQEYSVALNEASIHGIISNEILRVAYNFASDALIFLRLLISICDLKPLILWGTINENFILAEALRNLPWHRYNKKPALVNYRTTIADARNSAFHNLFPFRKTLNVPLPETAIKEATLTIFSEHRWKSQNKLLFQDKELVDLLFEFTRARERQVTFSFWERNLGVMDASIKLCRASGDYLKLLFSHVHD